jgi:hypothetical protein
LGRRIDLSAQGWAVSATLARALFWIPILGAIALIPTRVFADPIFRYLLTEDGPVEWTSFACFIVAAFAAAWSARRLAISEDFIRALAFGIGSVGLAFVAGEEISWGQRIFGFSTPEELLAVNKQGELTLHNVATVQRVMHAGMLLVGAWGTLMPVFVPASWRGGRTRALLDLVIPPFFLVGSFAVVFAYRLVRYTVWIPSGYSITRYAEWVEFCLAFGACAFLLLTCRNIGRRTGRLPLSGRSVVPDGRDARAPLRAA